MARRNKTNYSALIAEKLAAIENTSPPGFLPSGELSNAIVTNHKCRAFWIAGKLLTKPATKSLTLFVGSTLTATSAILATGIAVSGIALAFKLAFFPPYEPPPLEIFARMISGCFVSAAGAVFASPFVYAAMTAPNYLLNELGETITSAENAFVELRSAKRTIEAIKKQSRPRLGQYKL